MKAIGIEGIGIEGIGIEGIGIENVGITYQSYIPLSWDLKGGGGGEGG